MSPHDRLSEYREKRDAGKTPEPFGGGEATPRLFVVQKHAARRLHYDLRLEMHGVLVSWAVPREPSLDPGEKRLAVQTEDHPFEYADFEGVIPAGEYGAGSMIVWDRGSWVPLEDPDEGMKKGKLLFELRGYKLRGVWTLVHTKGGEEREWLLIKKPDEWADPGGKRELLQASILSGLTVEELAAGSGKATTVRAELERLEAPRRRLAAHDAKPMLAGLEEPPFTREGWLFELKYDGYRMLAARAEDQAVLLYRSGREATSIFPEIAATVAALPYDHLVVDGEVVILDEQARPSFQRLQRRGQVSNPHDVARLAVELPATLYVFDLLAFEDFDLRTLPLSERKSLLELLCPAAGPLRFADHVEEQGEALFEAARKMGLEGIVAKRMDSAYAAGRSPSWIKMRSDRSGDFAIVGFTRGKGSRDLGALHLGVWEGAGLTYAGRVGTGFSDERLRLGELGLSATDLDGLTAELERAVVATPQVRGELPKGPKHVWVEPLHVCEVRYKEWTGQGQLRHPALLRLRADKTVQECVRLDTPPDEEPTEEPAAPAGDATEPQRGERVIHFTRPEKVFWPDEGFTKGDLIDYYRAVAPALLPYLLDRPLVLDRYPDGIRGKSFYQKNAPHFAPDWIRTVTVWSADTSREIDYFVCDDLESLLYVANLGAIPLHIWSSRVAALDHPDWCILDLDPKEAPFSSVIALAQAIHELCETIGLPSFVKTSGSTGLHLLLPLGGQCTYEQSRQLGQLLARVMVERHPKIATVNRGLGARDGKVYLDFLQNRRGQLLVAPYSLRPLPGAPVSTPLDWAEVQPGLALRDHTIATVPKRLEERGGDPWNGILDLRPDLAGALARLLHEVET